jgi:hypothetical protein
MAIRKSSRSRPHRARPAGRSLAPSSRPHGRVGAVSETSYLSIRSVEGLRQLSILARRLRTIYGVAIAAEGALRHQSAEQDVEIADCLRVGVCDPVADQARDLEALIKRNRVTPPPSKSRHTAWATRRHGERGDR